MFNDNNSEIMNQDYTCLSAQIDAPEMSKSFFDTYFRDTRQSLFLYANWILRNTCIKADNDMKERKKEHWYVCDVNICAAEFPQP